MKFPMIINDERELYVLISRVATETARKTATQVLMQQGYIKPYMTKAECYRLSSRRKVDHAVKTGTLQYVIKGKSQMIKRDHFEDWINRDAF